MARQSLGRGFDVLIPKDLDKSILEEDKNRVQKLLITDIISNPDQPRRQFDDTAHSELTDSVKRHGVLQPIIVIKDGSGYRIVAGERRWRAARDAKLPHIPAIVRSLKELEQIELSLIENIQRVDLSALEQALSIYKLQHQFNLGIEAIAQKLGKAPSTVSNLSRLLQLPESAREALRSGKISEGHARAILAIKAQPAKQQELLDQILRGKWTVRQAEQFAVAAQAGATAGQLEGQKASEAVLTKTLGTKLNAPVKIKHTAKGGELVIGFSGPADLQRIIQELQK